MTKNCLLRTLQYECWDLKERDWGAKGFITAVLASWQTESDTGQLLTNMFLSRYVSFISLYLFTMFTTFIALWLLILFWRLTIACNSSPNCVNTLLRHIGALRIVLVYGHSQTECLGTSAIWTDYLAGFAIFPLYSSLSISLSTRYWSIFSGKPCRFRNYSVNS